MEVNLILIVLIAVDLDKTEEMCEARAKQLYWSIIIKSFIFLINIHTYCDQILIAAD